MSTSQIEFLSTDTFFLQKDVELDFADIQNISKEHDLIRFFTKLGYTTGCNVQKTAEEVGLKSKLLRNAFDGRKIECIASQDNGKFEIYLFNPYRLSASLYKKLVQEFKYEPDHGYLFILTSNYKRLNFLIAERYTPISTLQGKYYQQLSLPDIPSPYIRPRSYIVEPRKIDEVALRILKSFVYTETNADAQYEKILGTYIRELWSTSDLEWDERYFNNRALFSDYYLLNRLPERDELKSSVEQNSLLRAYKEFRDLYKVAQERYSGQSEEYIFPHLFERALKVLGFRAQTASEHGPSVYRLYSLESVNTLSAMAVVSPSSFRSYGENTYNIGEPAKASVEIDSPATSTLQVNTFRGPRNLLAYCLLYSWDRHLDGIDEKNDHLTPDENPGAVAVSLLDTNESDWVIVTNGRLWRLYTAKAQSRITNYYEINIFDLFAQNDSQHAFQYFWFFFRSQSFQLQPFTSFKEQGNLQRPDETHYTNFLDDLLFESERHARTIGKRLSDHIFEDIFPYFATGFVKYAQSTQILPVNLDEISLEESSKLLEPFFKGTLTLLYRLLFLSYAEARNLFPIRKNSKYNRYSLESMKQRIAKIAGGNKKNRSRRLSKIYSDQETNLYDTLQVLFQAIDKGDRDMNVPAYNGGLFMTESAFDDDSPEASAARFLQEMKIPDYYLAQGLDRLSRDTYEEGFKLQVEDDIVVSQKDMLVSIDYKDLGVRQLGSIYEGLLEFKLCIASEDMVMVKDRQIEKVFPLSNVKRDKHRSVFSQRSSNAKRRGYTKGEVYLINDRHERKLTGSYYTPDYIVQYIVERALDPILTDRLKKLSQILKVAEKKLIELREFVGAQIAELEIYEMYRDNVMSLLFDFHVLDPAIGSGHFLVTVVDYLTDRFSKVLRRLRWNPITYELGLIRKSILDAAEKQGISIDIDKLSDTTLLRRRILKSCIYGIDINPMAVELAKVSLWLHCFTLGAPLPFLDHHIKCGNALLGGDIQDAQRNFNEDFDYLAISARELIKLSENTDVTIEKVNESRDIYCSVNEKISSYKRLMDVWLSTHFRNKKISKILKDHSKDIKDNDYTALNESEKEAITAVYALATSKHFFHWELEFPEVFFNEEKRRIDAGFDVVIGNPPYVRQEKLGDDKIVFQSLYSVYHGLADLYTYFIERSHKILKSSGRFSMITSNKFIRAGYGAALRSYLINNVQLEEIVDFADLPVFTGNLAYPLIIVSSKSLPSHAPIKYTRMKNLKFKKLSDEIRVVSQRIPETAFVGKNWSLASTEVQNILDKLQIKSIPLGKYVHNKIEYGIKTGFNKAFVIDRITYDWLIAQDAKSAELLKPFLTGEDIKRYTSNFKEKYLIWTYTGVPIQEYPAIFRYLQQYQSSLEARRDKGRYWWELRRCDYYNDFERSKIIYPDIADGCRFAFDTQGFYSGNTTYIIPIESNGAYITALLNSKLNNFFYKSISSFIRNGYQRFFSQYVLQIPIRCIDFDISSSLREINHRQAQKLYDQYDGGSDRVIILNAVKRCLLQMHEQSSVVHDLLVLLTERMVRLNKERQEIQRKIITLFTNHVDIKPTRNGSSGFDSLLSYRRLLDFAGDYQRHIEPLSSSDLWGIIAKNSTRFVQMPDRNAKNSILTDYQKLLDSTDHITKKIESTDILIDHIVYQLYDLTEEEIAIVIKNV